MTVAIVLILYYLACAATLVGLVKVWRRRRRPTRHDRLVAQLREMARRSPQMRPPPARRCLPTVDGPFTAAERAAFGIDETDAWIAATDHVLDVS